MKTEVEFTPTKASYTIKEAIAYLGMSDKTVRRLIKRGLLSKSKGIAKIHLLGASVETYFSRTT